SKYPQEPHGGKLVNQVLTGKEREDALKRAENLPTIMVDLEAVITVEMIATGVLSPDRKSTRLNSSHVSISYAVFCLKKKIDCGKQRPCQAGRHGRDHLEIASTDQARRAAGLGLATYINTVVNADWSTQVRMYEQRLV